MFRAAVVDTAAAHNDIRLHEIQAAVTADQEEFRKISAVQEVCYCDASSYHIVTANSPENVDETDFNLSEVRGHWRNITGQRSTGTIANVGATYWAPPVICNNKNICGLNPRAKLPCWQRVRLPLHNGPHISPNTEVM